MALLVSMGPHTIRNPEVPAFGTSKASNRPYAVRGQRFSHTASTKDSAEYGIASWYGWTLASNPAVAADQDLGISRRYGDAVQSLSLNYITPAIPDAFKTTPVGTTPVTSMSMVAVLVCSFTITIAHCCGSVRAKAYTPPLACRR